MDQLRVKGKTGRRYTILSWIMSRGCGHEGELQGIVGSRDDPDSLGEGEPRAGMEILSWFEAEVISDSECSRRSRQPRAGRAERQRPSRETISMTRSFLGGDLLLKPGVEPRPLPSRALRYCSAK